MLGTILDAELSFEKHFERVVRSGYSALNQIKRFSANQKVPSPKTITLYKTLVRQIIEHSIGAAANIKESSMQKIISLQRACLLYATKCLPQTDNGVLNMVTNTLPLDLHLKLRVATKLIQVKSKNSPTMVHLNNWEATQGKEKVITTFCKMWMALKTHMTHHFSCLGREKIEQNIFRSQKGPKRAKKGHFGSKFSKKMKNFQKIFFSI